MEIEELIETLQELAEEYPKSEVRLAQQPTWSFEYSIGDIIASHEKEDDQQEWDEDFERAKLEGDKGLLEAMGDRPELGNPLIYIGEASQLGYLPGIVKDKLRW